MATESKSIRYVPAIEDTDNEEHVDGEQIVVPRNRRDLKADALSLWHLLTQKVSDLSDGQGAKRASHSRSAEGKHHTKVFGDCITADYFVFDRHSDDVVLADMIHGLVMLDVATGFLGCEPSRERDANTTAANLGCFAGGSAVKRLYTDDDGSLRAAAR